MITLSKIFTQETNITCGPACIKTIREYFNQLELEESYIASLANTNEAIGTSREDLENTLKTLGLKTHSQFDGTLDQVKEYINKDIPVIVYYWSEDDSGNSVSWFHYSIVVGISNEQITLADPWTGQLETIPPHEFLDLWYCDNGQKNWFIAVEK